MVPDHAGAVLGNAGISSSSHSLYYVVGMDTLCGYGRVTSKQYVPFLHDYMEYLKL